MLAKRAAPLLFTSLLVASAAYAQPAGPASSVVAMQAWSRATPPGAQTAVVYVTLKASVTDKLIAISTPAAKQASVHHMAMDGHVMIMRDLPGGLPLPAGQPVSLQPSGDHIMLTGLSAPLKLGQSLPLHLTFQVSPPIDIVANVATIGATQPPAATKPQ